MIRLEINAVVDPLLEKFNLAAAKGNDVQTITKSRSARWAWTEKNSID